MEEFLKEQNCMFLNNEKEVYKRLGHHESIVDWVSISEEGIEMAYMKNGPLSQYLQKKKEPSHYQISQWVPALAKGISYAHSRHVIIADIVSRNVLLSDNMSPKLCDFSDSAVLSLDSDMGQAEHYGLSAKTDIFQFGSLMYEVVTRQRYEYDLLANKEVEIQRLMVGEDVWQPIAVWPRPKDLPSINHLPLGPVILKCWTKGYEDIKEVCEAVEQAFRTQPESGRSTSSRMPALN